MAKTSTFKSIALHYRPDNQRAVDWVNKISAWLKKNYPKVKISGTRPQAVIALGGDGTILEAVKKYQKQGPLILGLNLGSLGFLASVREEKDFSSALKKFFAGKFMVARRNLLQAKVNQRGKNILTATAFNEIVVQNPVGIVELEVLIEKHPFQYIRGSGVMVATATGSTAYNLSAHGPIITPDIEAILLTEVLDHNLPTPSVVLKKDKKISIKVVDFRTRGELLFAKTKKPLDVALVADGEVLLSLSRSDEVLITSSPNSANFVEFDENHFLKSLQDKFAFK